jgi:hypothetical protein
MLVSQRDMVAKIRILLRTAFAVNTALNFISVLENLFQVLSAFVYLAVVPSLGSLRVVLIYTQLLGCIFNARGTWYPS